MALDDLELVDIFVRRSIDSTAPCYKPTTMDIDRYACSLPGRWHARFALSQAPSIGLLYSRTNAERRALVAANPHLDPSYWSCFGSYGMSWEERERSGEWVEKDYEGVTIKQRLDERAGQHRGIWAKIAKLRAEIQERGRSTSSRLAKTAELEAYLRRVGTMYYGDPQP